MPLISPFDWCTFQSCGKRTDGNIPKARWCERLKNQIFCCACVIFIGQFDVLVWSHCEYKIYGVDALNLTFRLVHFFQLRGEITDGNISKARWCERVVKQNSCCVCVIYSRQFDVLVWSHCEYKIYGVNALNLTFRLVHFLASWRNN